MLSGRNLSIRGQLMVFKPPWFIPSCIIPFLDEMGVHSRCMGSLTSQFMTMSMLLAATVIMVISTPNTTVISILCNGSSYTSGDPFSISLAYVLNDLVKSTPASKGREYYNISPFPNAFAYGYAACGTSTNVKGTDCSICLLAAIAQLNTTCSMRIGARAILADCNIRYEQYPFAN